MEVCISSELAATTETRRDTSSLAWATTLACTEVSSALPAICWLTAVSSSAELASAAAFCAMRDMLSRKVSRIRAKAVPKRPAQGAETSNTGSFRRPSASAVH
jgi:hypothetical protein